MALWNVQQSDWFGSYGWFKVCLQVKEYGLNTSIKKEGNNKEKEGVEEFDKTFGAEWDDEKGSTIIRNFKIFKHWGSE